MLGNDVHEIVHRVRITMLVALTIAFVPTPRSMQEACLPSC